MKVKAVLSVLLLAALTGAATALFRRKYIHVDTKLNWNEAQAYCRENYVDLATIETREELEEFQKDVLTSQWCWIGLSRNSNMTNFTQWSDGSLADFTQWGIYQPSSDKDKDKDCVSVKYFWYTYYCTYSQTFICYTWKPELIVVQKMKTWAEALRYCRMNYTDLVSLDTERDHLVVNNKSSEILTPSFWTGLRFLDGSWFWVNQVSVDEQRQGNVSLMPSCPAPHFPCGARKAESNVLENRDCEEKMNFICYNHLRITSR